MQSALIWFKTVAKVWYNRASALLWICSSVATHLRTNCRYTQLDDSSTRAECRQRKHLYVLSWRYRIQRAFIWYWHGLFYGYI